MKVSISKYWVSALGVGFIPKAPGTWGSLVGCAIWVLLPRAYFIPTFLAFFLVSCVAGVVIDKAIQERDPQYFVMDEVLGVGIPLYFFQNSLSEIALSFALFRLFDIWKPFPVRALDRLSHTGTSPWVRSAGVILDDIVAGFFAVFTAAILLRLYGLGLGA